MIKEFFTLRQVFIACLFLLIHNTIFAQVPDAFTYQGVVRNNGAPVVSTVIGVQMDILQSTIAGAVIYSENHLVNTNEYGQFTIQVGGGTVLSGNMATIDWAADIYFLNTQINFGAGLQDFGTVQLVSVPYAIQANKSATADFATSAGNAMTADTSNYAHQADTAQYAMNGSTWDSFGSHIYYWDGFVGVGIQPIAPFSVKGSSGFASSNDEAYSILVDDTGNMSFHANNMLGTGTPTLTLDDSNFKRVGLGISTPEEKLHLASGGVRMDEVQTTPAPKTAYGNSMPVAYGYFAGTTISQDYGIASISNPSTGTFNVVLDNNFSGAPVVMITSFNAIPGAEIATYSYTAPNIIRVNIADQTGTAKNSNFSLVVFGTPQ